MKQVTSRWSLFNIHYIRAERYLHCCVGMCCAAVATCASYDAHLATAPQHNMICCYNTSFANTN